MNKEEETKCCYETQRGNTSAHVVGNLTGEQLDYIKEFADLLACKVNEWTKEYKEKKKDKL